MSVIFVSLWRDSTKQAPSEPHILVSVTLLILKYRQFNLDLGSGMQKLDSSECWGKKSGWHNSDVLDQPQEKENHAGKFQKYHQFLLFLGKVKE